MELYIKGQKADLAPDAVFAVTVQSNDITKPDTVQSSYSNTLTLPYTQNNNALLDNANDPRSIGLAPYQKLEAAVLQDGAEVVPMPRIYLQQAAEGYELQVFSGAVDFFERLGDKSIRDLDLSRYDHPWTAQSLSDGSYYTRVWQDGYIYDIIDRGKPQEEHTYYPSVFARAILEQILSEAGVTTAFENLTYDDLIIPFSNDYPAHSKVWLAARKYSGPYTGGTFGVTDVIIDRGKLKVTYDFYVERMSNQQSVSEVIATLRKGNTILNDQRYTVEAKGKHKAEFTFDIPTEYNPEEYRVSLTLAQMAGPADPGAAYTWVTEGTLTGEYDEEAYFKTEWSIARNLPDIKQKDFFKAILALFNLMPAFDPYSNTLRLTPMQDLEVNKARALDWSDKLVTIGPVPVQYRFGEFAQKSLFRYKEEEENPANGDSFLVIQDQQLEAEKDVITLPFAASEERDGLLYLPMFELINKKPEGFHKTVKTISGLSLYDVFPPGYKVLVERASEDDPDVTYGWGIYENLRPGWKLIDQEQGYVRKKVAPRIAVLDRNYVAGFARSSFAPISFANLIPLYYRVLQGILDRCKGITPPFLLTAQEVQNYDCSIPVWLDQYQSYFYLNSIDEFTGEGPTNCQLWRL
ncbi:hypothetical protein OB13_10800 [Pontibacter sp. HJ8]